MHTRPVEPADEAFLFDVFMATRGAEISAWGLAPAQLGPLVHMQFTAQRRAYEMQYPGADHHIILLGEERIGQILVFRSSQEIVLVDISLLPQYRGAGAGTRLLQELQAEAARARLPLRLRVATTNPGARRLYERVGFTLAGQTDTHYAMEWRET